MWPENRPWLGQEVNPPLSEPTACLAAAALAFGPIVAKGGSPICRLRRLDVPSEERPPDVSAFGAIKTCGNFVTGQDGQALRVEWGPTWRTWVLILRAKGGTLADKAMGDGRWAMGDGRDEMPLRRKTRRVLSSFDR